jgi:hypothetical protein
MATQQIVIEAVNKTGAALGKVQKDLRGINTATNSLSSGFSRLQTLIVGAAAAFGGFKLAGGFLDTARQLENLGLQLKAITGSAQEGAKALDIVKDAAGRSAFQLQEMAQAAPLLLSVADSTEQLNELLAITGDIAVAGGLDFVQAAEQLQRTFSAGIASADLFRERGIKSMLGFVEGVQYSAEESKRLIIEGMQDGSISIAGIAAEMALSFDGSFSQIQDAVFRFQAAVMDAGPFDMLKSMLTVAVDEMRENFGGIEGAATNMGNKIVDVAKHSIVGFGKLLDALQPVFQFIQSSLNGLIEFTNALPTEIKLLGIVGFLALGIKGKLVVLAIGFVIDNIQKLFEGLMSVVGTVSRKIADALDFVGFDETAGKVRNFADDITESSSQIGAEIEDMIKGLDEKVNTNIDKIPGLPGIETTDKYEKMFTIFVERITNLTNERNKKAEESQEESSNKQVETVEQQIDKEAELLQKKLTTLQEALMNEAQSIENQRQKNLQLIEDNLAKQTITEEKAAELRVKVNEQAQEKIKKLDEAAAREAEQLAQKTADALRKIEEDYFQIKEQFYNTDEENIRQAYERRIEIVEKAISNEIDAETDKAKIIASLNKKMYDEIAKAREEAFREQRIEELKAQGKTKEQAESILEFENKTATDKSLFAIQKGRETFEALGTMNRQAFQAYKAFAIAEAIVSTYQGAAKALGAFPPPFNFIAAAAVVAQGFAQVNAIKSANYSGRAQGGPVGAGQTYMVGERGPETFRAPAGGGTIIPNGQGGGAVNVNFTVNAIDAQSFNSALSRQRNTIVSIVNEAVNNTGRRAITAY